MKHLHQLPVTDIAELFTRHWCVSEKYDGSFIRGGLDENGKFYTERKGNKVRYYSVDDWPDLPWTNGFRSAHILLADIIGFISENKKTFAPTEKFEKGDYLDCEIIYGKMPNAIKYTMQSWNKNPTSRLIIIGGSKAFAQSYMNMNSKSDAIAHDDNGLACMLDQEVGNTVWYSDDGSTMEKIAVQESWVVCFSETFWYNPKEGGHYKDVTNITKWLNKTLSGKTFITSRFEILNAKLNQKPRFIHDEKWARQSKEIIAELKELRQRLRKELEVLCNLYARALMAKARDRYFYVVGPAQYEGLVIYAPSNTPNGKGIICKLVDKEFFTPLNNFAHIVRYWLQGGRRPNRPSFMSRTQDWPVEKRLARLEVLRQRYADKKERIKLTNRFSDINYRQSIELDERTRLLFAELRQRISHGRTGIQVENTQDSESGS